MPETHWCCSPREQVHELTTATPRNKVQNDWPKISESTAKRSLQGTCPNSAQAAPSWYTQTAHLACERKEGLRLHYSAPWITCCFKFSISRPAQYARKEHIKQAISVGNFALSFSKHTAFLVRQMAQQTADSPTACIWLPWGKILPTQTHTDQGFLVYNPTPKKKPTDSRYI